MVFLPEHTANFGKHGSDKCFCVEMYGEVSEARQINTIAYSFRFLYSFFWAPSDQTMGVQIRTIPFVSFSHSFFRF